MINQVHIENPCNVSWEGMPKAGEGRHCGICHKVVVDFRNKTADEIRAYFEKPGHRDACGQYERRHTTAASRWERMVNRLEAMPAGGARRLVLLAISCLLLISSCSRRVVKGRRMSSGDRHHSSKSYTF